MDSTFVQLSSDSTQKSASQIYAKWIELPDCATFTLPDGTWDPTFGEVVQLLEDTSNAAIATCKGAAIPPPPPPVVYNYTSSWLTLGLEEPKPRSVIFDPVWKSGQSLEDK